MSVDKMEFFDDHVNIEGHIISTYKPNVNGDIFPKDIKTDKPVPIRAGWDGPIVGEGEVKNGTLFGKIDNKKTM